MEKTFAVIKPHAVSAGVSGEIIKAIEANGFSISQMYKCTVSEETAQQFYQEHKDKPFFQELVGNISAGPSIVMELERENAVEAWRELMGATKPQEARIGTLRAVYGVDISFNAVHGSDAPETAQHELSLFFPQA